MSLPLWALLGYAVWTLALVGALGVCRAAVILKGERNVNEFPAGTPHGSPAYWRLNRAHSNACENLPIFGAAVVVGTLAHVDTEAFRVLAVAVLALRVVHS